MAWILAGFKVLFWWLQLKYSPEARKKREKDRKVQGIRDALGSSDSVALSDLWRELRPPKKSGDPPK